MPAQDLNPSHHTQTATSGAHRILVLGMPAAGFRVPESGMPEQLALTGLTWTFVQGGAAGRRRDRSGRLTTVANLVHHGLTRIEAPPSWQTFGHLDE